MGDIKPIRSEADYQAALAQVETLWGSNLGTPEGDRLDVLATLIDAYEAEHHPIDPPDPIDAIKFRLEQQGLSRKDLEGILGNRSRIAEVLSRRRGLSLNMIRRLHERFGIPCDVLIRPCHKENQQAVEEDKEMPRIRELVYNAASTILKDKEFTRTDLVETIRNSGHDVNPTSVIPSDYLRIDAIKLDASNDGNRGKLMTYPRFLERLARNRYRFVGWDGVPEGSL